jgi:hypothetical protein
MAYAAVTGDAVQRRYWSFYEAVKLNFNPAVIKPLYKRCYLTPPSSDPAESLQRFQIHGEAGHMTVHTCIALVATSETA